VAAVRILQLLGELLALGAEQFIVTRRLLKRCAEEFVLALQSDQFVRGFGNRGDRAVHGHSIYTTQNDAGLFAENVFVYDGCIADVRIASRSNRGMRLTLRRSIPASSMASSLAFISTLARPSFTAGRRKVPASNRLYHRA